MGDSKMTLGRPGGVGGGLPPMPHDVVLAPEKPARRIDWRRLFFTALGLAFFTAVYLSPPWPAAVDPMGQAFELSSQGKAALGLFLLAATWWVFEVIPIGVTSIAIAVTQALFLIRPDKILANGEVLSGTWISFTDFLAPSVWFILGSITFGLCFTQTGLAKRMAYGMLRVVGEKTSMILLGCFVMTAALTFIMAHTAVAAAMYPLLMAIYALYTDDEERPSKFGKNMFIGMAYVAGAGSICTLLGAARGAVGIGFYTEIVGRSIGFFEYTYYLAPLGVAMVFVLWIYTMLVLPPERKSIPGLRERARSLYASLGPMTGKEKITLLIILGAIAIMSAKSFIPALAGVEKSAIILTATVLFFITKILTVRDLEDIPWNIILLFGGAMSIGYCLWQTGAAEWLAIQWLVLFHDAHWFIFVMAISFFVLIMTNLIMNVAAIAISLPVALVLAPYLSVAPEVILFSSLAVAGMPFLLLVGAAPNAIAYESKQFSAGEFFLWGVPASVLLMIVLGLFVWLVWPMMGMPVLAS